MRFSIILSVFNREEPVRNAIESVLAQGFPDWELVIVDDASTDGTLGVCEGCAMKDPRIRVLQCEVNKGLSGARNVGLDAMQGEYVLFLDSDDMIEADLLSSVDEVLRAENPDLVVFGSMRWQPPDSISRRVLDANVIRSRILPDHMGLSGHTEYFIRSFVTNKCFKRSMLEAHGLRFIEQRRVWEDNPFLVSYLRHCSSVFVIPKILYKGGPIQCGDNLSTAPTPDKLWNYIANIELFRELFGDEYDFASSAASRRRFEVLADLLPQYLKALPLEDSLALLRDLTGNATARSWMEHFVPLNMHERAFKRSFLSGNALPLFLLVRIRLLARAARNMLRRP